MEQLIQPIAETLQVDVSQIKNTLKLLEEGNTVPFIARYRKEMTKGLDEEQIRYIQEQYAYQKNLGERKEDVKRLIEQQGKLTEELIKEIDQATKLSQVEDIYRPYQQKKKTRATEAIRKGLEPFAEWMLSLPKVGSVEEEAKKYLNEEVLTVEEAIQGAKDIIAEKASDNAKFRAKIRESIGSYGEIVTKAKKNHEDTEKVYQMYYDYKEKVQYILPHRIMAINRAEKEKVITVSIHFDEEYLYRFALRGFTRDRDSIVNTYLEEAVRDGLKRLAFPSVEREIRNELTEKASEQSIDVFSFNVERLLSQPPLNKKFILGVDPAFRTGCKLAVIDNTGKVLYITAIYPHPPVNKKAEAEKVLSDVVTKYQIETIAIGNGTASRETESFVADTIKKNNLSAQYTIVSEAGASVYSASDLARAEFPELQVEQRSAISIARRLLDPLSELIKIDPKSIGVGQYQHDLPQKRLQERLDFAISKTVNRIGADLNTASEQLLINISGLNKTSSKAIVTYRNEHGKIKSREELVKIPKITKKVYEQAAGFLRIHDGKEPLDATSIHPESYQIVEKIMQKYAIKELGTQETIEQLSKINLKELEEELHVDEYTLEDIIADLIQPLRDYRDQYDGPVLKSDVLSLEDLSVGLELQGVVRNVVDFGVFVDIGLKNDGLVHISKMSKERVKHPGDLVSIGDIITVWVSAIDTERQKVQLSMLPIE